MKNTLGAVAWSGRSVDNGINAWANGSAEEAKPWDAQTTQGPSQTLTTCQG